MKILIGTGYSEPNRCTSKCLIRAFKELGHEVIVAGPVYGRYDTTWPADDFADIDLPDKKHPETYSYSEVLDKCPWKPDFILQIEPHFYFVGRKPENIKCYSWILDLHRGGVTHRDIARMGSFDCLFLAQPYFAKAYEDMKWLILYQALDKNRITYFPEIRPECDIAFVGETGIHPDNVQFDKIDSDGWRYCDKITGDFKIRSPYREYIERAYLIKMLMDDFKVRIYAPQTGDNYCKVIQKGEIGFHRSLFKDIALRPFEIAGCHRAAIVDDIQFLDEIFQHNETAIFYHQYGFEPTLNNFKLDYEEAYKSVKYALNNVKRYEIEEAGYELVMSSHTYQNRVNQILEYHELLTDT